MAKVRTGQVTDDHEGDVVVFLIGMRVNRWHHVRAWFPVFRAMPRMLAELDREKERGLLGAWGALGPKGPVVVQYWRDLGSLMTYAHAVDGEHRPAWQEFYRNAKKYPGSVGIWHETFGSPAGMHESVYGDMPPMGLAAATGAVPLGKRNRSARDRLVGAA